MRSDDKTVKKDHLYWEMKWQAEFKNEFARKPDDWEYPESYENCNCYDCNPRKNRPVPRSGDLPIQEARTADIEPVLEHLGVGQPVRKNGTWVTFCPFHNDSDPSLRIKPDEGLWYCFPCGEGGDMIDFWAKLTGDSFPETVRQLAEVGHD